MAESLQQDVLVYIIDDDQYFLAHLSVQLGSKGFRVTPFTSAAVFLHAMDQLRPGCVVMEARLLGDDGLETQDVLARRRPDLPTILISRNGDIPLAVAALKHGAFDFFAKPFDPDELAVSIRLALSLPQAPAEMEAVREKLRHLTRREREVLDHLVVGDTSKEIARTFHGSPRTVEVHRSRVLAKLGARNVADLVRIVAKAQM